MIERLATLFGSPETVVIISRVDDQRIVDVNAAFEQLVGIPRNEALGRTAVELKLWRDDRSRQTVIDQLTQRGHVREPIAVRARDGSFYDGLMCCEIIAHEGERFVFALFQDIRRYDDQAQSHVRELESFRSLFTQAEIGVYRRWPGRRGYVDVNPSMAAMLGYESPEQFMAERKLDVACLYVDPVHGAKVHAALKQDGHISRVHSQVRRRDGSTLWVSENARAVRAASGELLFYEGTVADIGDTVRAQEAMEQSERLYRSLVENCRDGVFLMQHGLIAFCNEALARALDFSVAELTGTSYFDHVAPEDLAAQQQRRVAREGGSQDLQAFEIHLKKKDGTPRLFEVRAGAVLYNGEPASIGTMRDVTEMRDQQRRLVETEERYRLALWGSGDDLFDWDLRAGTLTPISFDPEQPNIAIPMRSVEGLADFVHPDDYPGYSQAIREHMAGNTSFFEASYRLPNRAGVWKWKMARGMIVARDADGAPLRMSGTQKDITKMKAVENDLLSLTRQLDARVQERTRELQDERRELEAANVKLESTIEELRRTQGELIESEKMASLGRLVAGVAHEVNTPLGVGLTAVSFLRGQLNEVRAALSHQLSPERTEALIAPLESAGAMAESNMFRAAALVRSFKQVAVDQSTSNMRTMNVRGYLEEILQSLHPTLKKVRHQVQLDCDPDIEATSRPDALYQVIVNLVMNSVLHAFPEGKIGNIRIQVTNEDKLLHLRYEDDGVGMDSYVAERIFEPFFTTRREHGGTGLGMHIVYNLVTQALAGRIACVTAPGQGVRFDVRFPRMHPNAV